MRSPILAAGPALSLAAASAVRRPFVWENGVAYAVPPAEPAW